MFLLIDQTLDVYSRCAFRQFRPPEKWLNLAKILKSVFFSKHDHIRNIQYPFEWGRGGGGWDLFVFQKYFLDLLVEVTKLWHICCNCIANVISCVPQATVLGPWLYFLFINILLFIDVCSHMLVLFSVSEILPFISCMTWFTKNVPYILLYCDCSIDS